MTLEGCSVLDMDMDVEAAAVAAPEAAPGDAAALPWLSVVLPAHNEAEHIARVALDFLGVSDQLGRSVEVIVVDDGSTDGTAEIARAATADPRLRVIPRSRCGGYGRALITGFTHARGEWVFFTDSDGQFSAADLPAFARATDAAQLVIGYRAHRADGTGRLLLGRAWTLLVRAVLGVSARDVNCAYKILRRADLEAMRLCSDGAMINAELLHKAGRMGLQISQRPVQHFPRDSGQQSGARVDVMLRAATGLARYRLAALRRRLSV